MSRLSLLAFSTALQILIADNPAAGDDIANIQSSINAYNHSGICPKGNEYALLTLSGFCKYYCDRTYTCNRDHSEAGNPCKSDYSSDACHAFNEGSERCVKEMNEKNQIILSYNDILRRCHQHQGENAPPPNRQNSKQETDVPPPDATIPNKPNKKDSAAAQKNNSASEAADCIKNMGMSKYSSATQKKCLDCCDAIDNSKDESKISQACALCVGAYEDEDKKAEAAELQKKQQESNFIPPGWRRCSCPGDHMYLVQSGRAKLVNGVLYHGDVGPCE
jgi:hypothetical protein